MKNPSQRTTVVGRPAHHARGLAAAALKEMLIASGGIGLILLSTFLLYRTGSSLFPRLAILGSPFALIAAVKFSSSRVRYLQARVGVVAEERVSRVLSRCGGEVLLNGVLLGAGDIDHVLLGPCAAAVETKYARGSISFDRDGRLRVGNRTLPRDPLAQAARNAAMLSRHLGLPVTALLVLSEGEGSVHRRGDVIVLPASALSSVIAGLPRVLTTGAASSAASGLKVADQMHPASGK